MPVKTELEETRLSDDGSVTEETTFHDDLPSADASAADDRADDAESTEDAGRPGGEQNRSQREGRWKRLIVYGLIPTLALSAGVGAGVFKWISGSASDDRTAAAESVQAARDSTVALLSYQPDTVQATLEAARSRLTGSFRDSYDKLIHDVVIPGAKQQRISAVANVPAAASISATGSHATVLVFVDQTSIIGKDAPVNTASTVRVTLDKVDGTWLISSFDPV